MIYSKSPGRLEHYGISVIEAMSYGCIPLVIGNGGPKETVDNNINGVHWKSKKELVSAIAFLIKNEDLRKKMSQSTFLKSQNFSFDNLEQKFKTLISK